MKRYKTKKLFYGKYLYRTRVRHCLTRWLDYPKYKTTNALLDRIDNKFNELNSKPYPDTEICINPLVPVKRTINISFKEYQDALKLKEILTKNKDFSLRKENNELMIYTNDMDIPNKLIKANLAIDLTEPDPNNLSSLESGKLIVSDAFKDYKYKVIVNNISDSKFPKWVENNKGKIKISEGGAKELKNGHVISSLQIYVRDDIMLTVLNMRISDKIKKVYELEHN